MAATRPRPLALVTSLLAAAMLLAGATLPATVAAHDQGASGEPTIRVRHDTVAAGRAVVVRGVAMGRKARVVLTLDDTVVRRQPVRTDRHGRFTAYVRVPAGTTVGDHVLAATATSRDSSTRTASLTLHVVAYVPDDEDGWGDRDWSGGSSSPGGSPSAAPTATPTPTPTPTSTPTPVPTATPVPVTGPLAEGIDVSHWQGTIDWARVAKAGKSFAYIKATESTTFLDSMYATNRSRAKAAGLVTGAYHFARPSSTAGDGAAEAKWFVKNAQIGSGDLIPVLDLEASGGLSTSALTAWLKGFLGQVYTSTGVRPAIYVSPSFWKTYVGNSRWFADNGYRILWVAHWTSSSTPTVPGSNWGGRGWTFWQYTSGGSVPGITGRVDLDRYNGTSFTRVLVP